MSTDALSALAREALTERGDVVWYFPDWGFFMPFAFLTGNQVPYQLALNPEALEHQRGKYGKLRVALWNQADQESYERFLREQGVQDVRTSVMLRRDGQPAFYVLEGRLDGAAKKVEAP